MLKNFLMGCFRHCFKLFSSIALILLISTSSVYFVLGATQTWEFDSSSDYTFNNSKISISSSEARLATSSDWYNNSWPYRKSITINNTSNTSDFYNLQIEIILSSANFDFSLANSDGSDIRFTDQDGITIIDHWIEAYDSSAQSAYINVEIPTISGSSSKTIYVYYGNSSASGTSSWNNTFTSSSTDPTDSNVYTQTTHDAFPGAVQLDNEDIIVSFRTASSHLSSDGQIKMARSTDDGDTWQISDLYNDASADDRSNIGLVQLSDGTLIQPFFKYNDSTQVRSSYIIKSTDNGSTWGTPIAITEPFSLARLSTYGKIIELPNGDLEMPVYGQNNGQKWRAALMKSVNDGVTWTLQSTIAYDTTHDYTETDILRLDANNYVAVTRDTLSEPDNLYSVLSTDGGNTWGTPTLLFEGVSPNLLSLDDGDILLCVGDRSVTHSIRCHLSYDSGLSWTDGVIVYEAPFDAEPDLGYPTTIQLSNSSLITYSYKKTGTNNTDIIQTEYTKSFVSDSNKYNFFDGMESGNLNSWAMAQGSNVGATNTIQHSGNYSFYLNDVDTVTTSRAMIALPMVRNTASISFWINSDTIANGNNFGLADGTAITNNADSRFQLSIRPTTRKLQYYNGTAYVDLSPAVTINADQWYKIGLDFDAVSNTAEVFVNGESKGNISIWQSGIEITHLFFGSGSTSGVGDIFYVDDIYMNQFVENRTTESLGSQSLAFPTDSPSIYPNSAISFASISGFSEVATKNGGEIKYQISNNSGNDWYWYDSGWSTTSSGYQESNTASIINSNISSFPSGNGQFKFKAYLNSNGTQFVRLDSINLTHVQPSPTPTDSPRSTSTPNPNAGPNQCTDVNAGTIVPHIYQATPNSSNSIRLYFTPNSQPNSGYVLEYGTESGIYKYSVSNLDINSSSNMEYDVNALRPNTIYYFRVRGQNGCKTGQWSNEIFAKTDSVVEYNQLDIIESNHTENKSDFCQKYIVKKGDSLWSIAKELTGSGANYVNIISQNTKTFPELQRTNAAIEVGWELLINCQNNNNKTNEKTVGADIHIKVVGDNKEPIKNAKVTLYSEPKVSYTNSDGYAYFEDVESGNHKIVINYESYQGEQSIDLSEETKELDINITVKQDDLQISQKLQIILIFIGISILTLLILIYKNAINKKNTNNPTNI